VTIVGDTTDIAMALQGTAAPGTIVLGETTADQVVGYIRLTRATCTLISRRQRAATSLKQFVRSNSRGVVIAYVSRNPRSRLRAASAG
jgi:class 3 adenylate cyclase